MCVVVGEYRLLKGQITGAVIIKLQCGISFVRFEVCMALLKTRSVLGCVTVFGGVVPDIKKALHAFMLSRTSRPLTQCFI